MHFTATSSDLSDSIDINAPYNEEATSAPPEIEQRQVIRVRLRPGRPQDDDFSETTFSMFGTGRAIKNFELQIWPVADPAKQESCTAWGSVSYTAEVDFRNETSDDCIVFHLFVMPETFARYAAKIAYGSVDEILFSVKSVAGFYSEWSPSISTDNVKVLTNYEEQKITLPPGLKFEPPRLGHVGKAALYINRHLEFRKRTPTLEAAEEVADEMAEFKAERAIPVTQTPAAVSSQLLQMMQALKRPAWFVVCLLALIFIVILSKR